MRKTIVQIYRSWQHVVRKVHVLTGTYGVPVNLVETHVFVELIADPEKTATELTKAINIDKTSLSRVLKGMTTKGYIKSAPLEEDRRIKRLAITARGRAAINAVDEKGNQFVDRLLAVFSAKERQEFTKLIKEFADMLGVSPGIVRPTDHPFRGQLRRLPRAFNMFSDSTYGSAISVTQEYVLTTLTEVHDTSGISLSELAKLLGADISTLSRSVQKLVDLGYVTKFQASDDARKSIFRITAKGRHELEWIERRLAEEMEPKLKEFKKANLERLAELMAKAASSDTFEAEEELDSGLTLRQLKSSAERQQARLFFLGEMFSQGKETEIGSALFSEDGICFGAFDSRRRLMGVCELIERGNSWVATNLISRRDADPSVATWIKQSSLEELRERSR